MEFVTHDVSIRPGRYTFDNLDELTAYLGEALGGQSEGGGGSRGSLSRRGRYVRRAADGTQVFTFGDPVLDAISSTDGTLVLGGQIIDLRASRGSAGAPSGADAAPSATPHLKSTGMVNGAERWASDDGSLVQYRMGAGRLNFHAWKRDSILPYWSMGGEISISGTKARFQAADLTSHYYMSVDAPCQIVKIANDSDHDDDYVDQYEWGINAPQPERVAVLCRAQWHHAQFADIVTAGEGCPNYRNDAWPIGFPSDWATIRTLIELNGLWTDGSSRNATISVKFRSLAVNMSAFHRPAARGSVVDGSTITVTFPDDTTYTGTLRAPDKIRWSNGSVWTKVVNTVLDLNGSWTDGSTQKAVISEGTKSLTIDMSDYDRPVAHGSITANSVIQVTFPDDATYTGTLQPPDKIRWSNGSAWTKV
ncbi:hypothetical protein [Frankia sp. QA3]|uniref:hypothetical protein n=1 Tax=Frankia sp. QA3 TaxID=710111 RepID=UPI0018DED09B|nr:hypothetical protein [Frankia sp. QA3]